MAARFSAFQEECISNRLRQESIMPVKKLLAAIAYRHAIGIHVGEREVFVCKLASSPLGPIEMARKSLPYTPENLSAVISELLVPLTARRLRLPIPVALGLPGQRVFFSTRPIKSANADATPQILLHEVLQSSSISVDDMAVDLIKSQFENRTLASIASCRRKFLASLLSAFTDSKVVPFRAEPAPSALFRIANSKYRAPRRAKTVLRIMMGTEQGLAILAVGSQPLVWRYFTLPQGSEKTAIISTTRTLQTLSKPCGIEAEIDVLIVHGRPDLKASIENEQTQDEIGIPIQWCDNPILDDSEVAYGLALGCLMPGIEAYDLARSLKPPRSLLEIFPWGELGLQTALIAFMGMFLSERASTLGDSYRAVRREIAGYSWLKATPETQLEKERKDLEQRVESVRKFLDSRIVWTSYFHDIPARLPANASINGFDGMSEMELMGKKKDIGKKLKKSFILRLAAPITNNGTMPHEIDKFLDSLREHPLLKKDFPIVELVDLKWYQPFQGAKPNAYFTVMCLPKVAKPVAKPEGDAH